MRILASCRRLLLTSCLALSCLPVAGQDPLPKRYFPLNTPLPPPGRAGDWAARAAQGSPLRFQPVEIQLPGEGQVTWYSGGPAGAMPASAPSMAGLLLGPVYRVKLSGLADFPGLELYPTIELVDRLHPPAGRANEFPVIVQFTADELELAERGQLITKIIYLEQPNRASLQSAGRGQAIPAVRVGSRENPLEIADLNGRPLAIVRLGGRVPDTNRPEPGFFGSGAPVKALERPPVGDRIEIPAVRSPGPAQQPAPMPEVNAAPDSPATPEATPPQAQESETESPVTPAPEPQE